MRPTIKKKEGKHLVLHFTQRVIWLYLTYAIVDKTLLTSNREPRGLVQFIFRSGSTYCNLTRTNETKKPFVFDETRQLCIHPDLALISKLTHWPKKRVCVCE